MVKRGISMQCSNCKELNYITRKNAKKHPEKLELSKHCPRCNKPTVHKESKKK